jgi:hypothetical protein
MFNVSQDLAKECKAWIYAQIHVKLMRNNEFSIYQRVYLQYRRAILPL